MFSKIVHWCSPAKATSKTYEELMNIIKKHIYPQPSLFSRRVKFFNERQKPGESPLEYFSRLHQLVGLCALSEMKVDELAVLVMLRGLEDEPLKRHMMNPSCDISSISKAQQVIISFEQSRETIDELRPDNKKPNPMTVNVVGKGYKCKYCGETHARGKSYCPAANTICENCKRKGHYTKVCRSGGQHPPKPGKKYFSNNKQVNQVEEHESEQGNSSLQYPLNGIVGMLAVHHDPPTSLPPPILITAEVNGVNVSFQHDTGAATTVIDEKRWELIGKPKLKPSKLQLHSYNQPIPVLGTCLVDVVIGHQQKQAWLYVVQQGDSILGRDWISYFNVKIEDKMHGKCNVVQDTDKLKEILDKYESVFKDELGTCDIKVALKLTDSAKPVFLKHKTLPYELRKSVEKQLDERVKAGILEPVQHSEMGTPILAVKKANGDFRICGNYKATLNPMLDVNQYPLPKIEDVFHEFIDGKFFSKIDLRDAYHQLVLDDSSKKLTTITTHRGMYQYNRLPFGIASAVAIFQHTMEHILQGIPGVIIYIDDITIVGSTLDEHLARVAQVLQRIADHGMRLKREKCQFLMQKLEFLGHEVDGTGIRPLSSKLSGLTNMPPPSNIKELESFIGFVTYYGRFIQGLSSLAAPLNDLRKKNTKWSWNSIHQKAFTEIKDRLLNSSLLVHYDPNKPLIMATDASEYGVGAVIYHRDEDGTEHIIANASRKLTTAERNYAQIEKEGLGIIFGLHKFSTYLLGRKFTLLTDHQPLVRIFGPKIGMNSIAMKRLERWAIIMLQYDYTIEYRRTEDFANADGLSRLPDPLESSSAEYKDLEDEIEKIFQISDERSPLNLTKIAQATSEDPELSQIIKWIQEGWPKIISEQWKSWYNRKDQLSVRGKYLLHNDKPVIPAKLQDEVLTLLHEAHVGRNRMLLLARDSFWFKNMTSLISKIAQACHVCNSNFKGQEERLHSWEKPEEFWDRIHIDYAGPFHGQMWLVIVDAKINWIEIVKCSKSDSRSTIEALKPILARFGLPKQLVSDNGTCFASSEFKEFCKARNIQHTFSPPYHPQSNGIAERAVRTFKEWVERHMAAGHNLDDAVMNMLLLHRSTRHDPSKASPAEELYGRPLRSRMTIHQVHESMQGRVKGVEFKPNDKVWVRYYSSGPRWRPGYIKDVLSKVLFLIECQGEIVTRHRDQIRRACENPIRGKSPSNLPIGEKRQQKSRKEPITESEDSIPLALSRTRREIHPPSRFDPSVYLQTFQLHQIQAKMSSLDDSDHELLSPVNNSKTSRGREENRLKANRLDLRRDEKTTLKDLKNFRRRAIQLIDNEIETLEELKLKAKFNKDMTLEDIQKLSRSQRKTKDAVIDIFEGEEDLLSIKKQSHATRKRLGEISDRNRKSPGSPRSKKHRYS